MRSSDEQRSVQLHEAHREKVARNEVRASPLWAQHCRAYNVQIELDPRTTTALGKIQQSLKQAEPDLLACPQKTLHVSLALPQTGLGMDHPSGKAPRAGG